ncbi:MAG: crossover junction endodeoxyribonuclease RuvC, partial [Planctomycetota bacterium]|nr:crossover junction endodeoxyribonuclease RuvC [Planctomycetota bacterium]
MRVVGIDPGTVVVGWACLEVAPRRASTQRRRARNEVSCGWGGSIRLVDSGTLRLGQRQPIEQRLLALGRGLDALLERLAPTVLAVEEAYTGRSPQSSLRIGEARGVVLFHAAAHRLQIAQYPPATIKKRVAGSGAASKQVLAKMTAAGLGRPLDGLPAD